ncbi:hypothetical protein ACLOJK_032888 [Asimina triloba]
MQVVGRWLPTRCTLAPLAGRRHCLASDLAMGENPLDRCLLHHAINCSSPRSATAAATSRCPRRRHRATRRLAVVEPHCTAATFDEVGLPRYRLGRSQIWPWKLLTVRLLLCGWVRRPPKPEMRKEGVTRRMLADTVRSSSPRRGRRWGWGCRPPCFADLGKMEHRKWCSCSPPM